jgi:2-oxoglutarate ferredoxin oxidoreductase subunit gamma
MDKVERITIAGFGGQGVMMIGQILAHAGNDDGLNSLWFPSYGPETRGGTANCAVIISKDYINSPIFSKADVLIALNMPSLLKFLDKVDTNGVIFYNSSLISGDVDSKVLTYAIPVNDIAQELGNPKVANLVILGAYMEYSKLFSRDLIESVLKGILGKEKQSLVEINMLAFDKGRSFIREQAK